MGILEGFSFSVGHGRERRGVEGNDNVLWDDGHLCVAVLVENESTGRIRVDYGLGKRPGSDAYPRTGSAYVDDLLTARCIALEWIATYGGKK